MIAWQRSGRKLPKEDEVRIVVRKHTKDRDLQFLGEPRVHVLELNLELDTLHPLR
jgi:K+-transporting ATPase ATPase C chain